MLLKVVWVTLALTVVRRTRVSGFIGAGCLKVARKGTMLRVVISIPLNIIELSFAACRLNLS